MRKILILILIIATLLRFYNLMHDAPYFFNPDERNMANAITALKVPKNTSLIFDCLIKEFTPVFRKIPHKTTPVCSLDPHFYAYGQFPLYLSFASDQLMKGTFFKPNESLDEKVLTTNFPSAVYWLRFYSALTSVLTVYIVYLITRSFWTKRLALLSAAITAFLPGLIQASHFGTTESLLTFFFMVSVYLSLKLKTASKKISLMKIAFLLALIIGLSLGSKLTGLFLFIPPLVALSIAAVKTIKSKKNNRLNTILFLIATVMGLVLGSIIFAIISSPYNVVEVNNFKSAVFGYERDVAVGRYDAFYTRQFIGSLPLLFQFKYIFPYALGWPVFAAGLVGFFLIMFKLASKTKTPILNSFFLILTSSFLIYLIPNALLYAKWSRFMTPIFPFFAIFTAYFISLLINKTSKVLIFIICLLNLLPGAAFMSIYTNEDTRISASKWIYQNIPDNVYILSETANVVDIPVGLPDESTHNKNYTVISFDFYHLHENPLLFDSLINHLSKSQYLFIPSRRVFANHAKDKQKYEIVNKYYDLLFSGALGYKKVAQFSSFPKIGIEPLIWEINDEGAEETMTVFDHPVVRIYKKITPFSESDYRKLFIAASLSYVK